MPKPRETKAARAALALALEVSRDLGQIELLTALVDTRTEAADDEIPSPSALGSLMGRVVEQAGVAYYRGFRDGLDRAWREAGRGEEYDGMFNPGDPDVERRSEAAERPGWDALDRFESTLTGLLERRTTLVLSKWSGYLRYCEVGGADGRATLSERDPGMLAELDRLVGPANQVVVEEFHRQLEELGRQGD